MASVRLGLTGDLDVYVSSAGSDTTGDGTQGNPWATISHAYDVFATDYDLRRKTVTVHLLTNMAGPGLLQGELPGLLNPLSFHIRSDNPAAPVTLTVPAGQPQNAVCAAGFRAAFSVSDVIVQGPSGGFGFLCEGGKIGALIQPFEDYRRSGGLLLVRPDGAADVQRLLRDDGGAC